MFQENMLRTFFILFVSLYSVTTSPPNILVIVADDLGYNDIAWHNPEIVSPNLEKLAKDGIILENHYVSLCSATRGALLTGYYPIHTGLQHGVISNQEPKGLYKNFTLMSEYFRDIGYRTHIVGKWHLGFCHEDYLPLRRGFDTFYGKYLGMGDYFDHTDWSTVGVENKGYDFHNQNDIDISAEGTYSSTIFAERAVKIFKDHVLNHSNKSIFMYLPFQSVHKELQVPKEYYELYPNINDGNRRIFSAMVSAMDDAVGMIVEELKSNDLLDNTIIVFMSDNGGFIYGSGNNYPLRGTKSTLWEGGTKSVSFIYSKMLENKGTKNDKLFHVVDWLPTLLTAVKNSLPSNEQHKVEEFFSEEWDGVDQWDMLTENKVNKRSEFVYNIDPLFLSCIDELNGVSRSGSGAIRIGDLKLIVGDPGSHDGHYTPEFISKIDWTCVNSAESYACSSISCNTSNNEPEKEMGYPFMFREWPTYLFDLKNDPNEYYNIAINNLDVVEEMLQRYKEYESSMIPPNSADEIEEGNPINFNGVWSSGWCESEPGLM